LEVATTLLKLATILGCADNGLGAPWRQCFYLALLPTSCQTMRMSPLLQNLYVDHSAITDENWWPQIDAAVATGRVRLAVSLWNLVEIGGATDLKQRERRIVFLERNDPVWIIERVGVQRQEVKRFLWINRFGVAAEELVVFTPHLSVVDAFLAGSHAQVGLTARGFIERTDFAGIEKQKELAPDALRRLQAVDRKTFKARQHEIFRPWIKNLIPATDPEGKALSIAQTTELLTFCEAHRDRFLSACPSLAVEDALTLARTADSRRKPQRSDGIDLMHTVIALSYCDYFLVRDRFARNCAEQAIKALRPMSLARVYDDPATLVVDLKSSKRVRPAAA
jgi:hypothetical protein